MNAGDLIAVYTGHGIFMGHGWQIYFVEGLTATHTEWVCSKWKPTEYTIFNSEEAANRKIKEIENEISKSQGT